MLRKIRTNPVCCIKPDRPSLSLLILFRLMVALTVAASNRANSQAHGNLTRTKLRSAYERSAGVWWLRSRIPQIKKSSKHQSSQLPCALLSGRCHCLRLESKSRKRKRRKWANSGRGFRTNTGCVRNLKIRTIKKSRGSLASHSCRITVPLWTMTATRPRTSLCFSVTRSGCKLRRSNPLRSATWRKTSKFKGLKTSSENANYWCRGFWVRWGIKHWKRCPND